MTSEQLELLRTAASAGQIATALRGRHVAVTGTLSLKRDEVRRILEACGATLDGAVTRRTTYLVCGRPVAAAGGGKTAKQLEARRLGVRIITEDDFARMLSE